MDKNLTSFLRFLRSLVQSQESIAYTFSGSIGVKDNLIDDISGKRGAFGGRILPIELKVFSFETTKSFLIDNAGYLNFTEDGYEQFYKCTGGIPYYITSFARLLTPDVVLDKDEIISEFHKSLDYLVSNSKKEWYKLTKQEQKIVASLVDNPLRRVDIANKLGVTSGAIGNSINHLIDAVLIEHEDNHYYIIDKIFKAWLKDEYDKKGVFPFK